LQIPWRASTGEEHVSRKGFSRLSVKFLEGISIPAINLTENGIEKPKRMTYFSRAGTR
jgi:hypothetical protein